MVWGAVFEGFLRIGAFDCVSTFWKNCYDRVSLGIGLVMVVAMWLSVSGTHRPADLVYRARNSYCYVLTCPDTVIPQRRALSLAPRSVPIFAQIAHFAVTSILVFSEQNQIHTIESGWP